MRKLFLAATLFAFTAPSFAAGTDCCDDCNCECCADGCCCKDGNCNCENCDCDCCAKEELGIKADAPNVVANVA